MKSLLITTLIIVPFKTFEIFPAQKNQVRSREKLNET